MVFKLDVSKNQETILYMAEFNNDRMEDEGNRFEAEDDGIEGVFKGIGNTINKSFSDIEPDEKA